VAASHRPNDARHNTPGSSPHPGLHGFAGWANAQRKKLGLARIGGIGLAAVGVILIISKGDLGSLFQALSALANP